jgi:integrase
MGRDFIPVKYRKGSRNRTGHYYTSEQQPNGRWKQIRLLTADESEDNKLRAYQIYLSRQGKLEPAAELPKDLIVLTTPPKVRLVRREPDPDGGLFDTIREINKTPEEMEQYLNSLPAEQAEVVRIEIARITKWQRSFTPGRRVTDLRRFDELEREREDAVTAERAGRRLLGMDDTTQSEIRLQQCLDAWVEDRKAAPDPFDPKYLANVTTRFRRFMAVVGLAGDLQRRLDKISDADEDRGNVHLHELTARHFADFRLWASRQPELGPKAFNDHMLAIGTVLRYVDETRPAWQIPPQLLAWTSKHLKNQKYAPGEENSEPMPVDVFRNLLARADKWTATVPPEVDKRTRSNNPQFLRADQCRRQGVVMRAVLLFKLNIAGDNVDLCRLRPDQLVDLDGQLPWVDLPRPKMRRKKGKSIPRKIPLLPSTVAALRKLRDIHPDDGRVFVGEAGPFTSGGLTQAYRELADDIGVTQFTLRHLRNVGATIGTRRGVASYLVDALLGHVIPTATKFYVGRGGFTAADLVPVVNAIGAEYLGEMITTS